MVKIIYRVKCGVMRDAWNLVSHGARSTAHEARLISTGILADGYLGVKGFFLFIHFSFSLQYLNTLLPRKR